MPTQEQTRIRWTPLKVMGAIVVGALAAWGLAVLVFIWMLAHANFTF
jgi:hypothetical protein